MRSGDRRCRICDMPLYAMDGLTDAERGIDEMKIIVTLREILDKGDWDKYCELSGINPWCINEGFATSDEEVELAEDIAKQIGMWP